MINIGDKINYLDKEWTCWFIEELDGETYLHLIYNNEGICLLDNELKK